MYTAASCCLEQTSTVLTVNRPGNTIPSSVPFSCWRAHTVLSLLSPLAQLNWSSLYHHLVLPIYNISDDFRKGVLNENYYVWKSSWMLHISWIITWNPGRWLHCSGTWIVPQLLHKHHLYTSVLSSDIPALWGEM